MGTQVYKRPAHSKMALGRRTELFDSEKEVTVPCLLTVFLGYILLLASLF